MTLTSIRNAIVSGLTALLLLTFSVVDCFAALPFVLSDKDDVKDVISHFSAEMQALIAQAGGETRVTLVRAFQLSQSMISAITAAYGDSLKLTIGQLNEQQKKAFSDTYHLLDQIDQAIKDPANKALQEFALTNAIVADVASWSKRPIVTAYSPGYVAPALIGDTVRVTIFGARLHGAGVDSPFLKIDAKEFQPTEYTDVSIGFSIPRSSFPPTTKEPLLQSAVLIIYHDGGGWSPWRKAEEIPFRLLFTVLPESLGTYSTSTVLLKPRVVREHFRSPILKAAKDGGGGDIKTDCYSPKAGYTFDLTTAYLIEDKHTAHKDNDTSSGTNDGGISYKDQIKTDRLICPQVIAHTGCTECGAVTEGHLEVDMVTTVTDEVPSEVDAKPLNWKEDTVIKLVENAKSQLITLKLFDSITTVASATTPHLDRFLKVDPDLQNAVTILRPQREWTAR